MAGKSKEINIRVELDGTKAVVKETKVLERSIKDVGDEGTRTGRSMTSLRGKLGSTAALAGGAAAAAFGVALYQGMSRAITKGSEFEAQLAELEAITGIAGDRLEQLGGVSLELSQKYGSSASQIVEAHKLVAGIMGEKIDFKTQEGFGQLQDMAEQAIILQKAAGIDLQTAVNTTTNIINQFGLEVSESARVINTLAAGSKFGAAEVDDIGSAMVNAGSAAGAANISLEATTAAIEVLAARGIQGERAGTALRAVFLRLQTRSKKLAELGLGEVNLKSEGLVKTLQRLKPIAGDAAQLNKLFGEEAYNAAQIIINQSDSIAELTEKVTGTNTAREQAAVNMDTFENTAARLSSTLDAELIRAFQETNGVGVELMNTMIGLVSATGDVIRAMSDVRQRRERIQNIIGGGNIIETFSARLNAPDQMDKMLKKTREVTNQLRYLGVDAQTSLDGLKEHEEGTPEYKAYQNNLDRVRSKMLALRGEAQENYNQTKKQIAAGKELGYEMGLQEERLAEISKRYKAANKAVEQYGRTLEEARAAIKQQLAQHEEGDMEYEFYAASLEKVNERIAERNKKQKEANKTQDKQKDAVATLTEKLKAAKTAQQDIIDQTGPVTQAQQKKYTALQQNIAQWETLLKKRRESLRLDAAIAMKGDQVGMAESEQVAAAPAGDPVFTGDEESPEERKIKQQRKLNQLIVEQGENYKTVSEIIAQGSKKQSSVIALTADQWGDVAGQTLRAAANAVVYGDTMADVLKGTIRGLINAIIAYWIRNALQSAGATGPGAFFTSPAFVAGAVAAATAATSALLDFGLGGVLDGPSHADGGVTIMRKGRAIAEAEGDEAIINTRSTQMFYDELSAMNVAGGGNAFPGAANIAAMQDFEMGGPLGPAPDIAETRQFNETIVRQQVDSASISAAVSSGVKEALESADIVARAEFQEFHRDYEDFKKYQNRIGN